MSDARLRPLPLKHDFGVLPAPELVCKTPVSLVNICTTYALIISCVCPQQPTRSRSRTAIGRDFGSGSGDGAGGTVDIFWNTSSVSANAEETSPS